MTFAAPNILQRRLFPCGRGGRGIATLEMVMVLPLLMVFLVFTMAFGRGVVLGVGTTIEARRLACEQARDHKSGKIFNFDASTTRADLMRGESTRQIPLPNILGAFPDAGAEHYTMGGSWDHDEIRLNSPLHWTHYAKTAGGPGGGITGVGSSANSLQSILQSFGGASLPDLSDPFANLSPGEVEDITDDLFAKVEEVEKILKKLEDAANSLNPFGG